MIDAYLVEKRGATRSESVEWTVADEVLVIQRFLLLLRILFVERVNWVLCLL